MSAMGLDVFDKTVQTTHIWLKELCEVIGPDQHLAWHVLGAVLRAIRDRLTVDLAAHLGSQLPLLVRGAYYDRFRPSELPNRLRSRDEFLQCINADLEMSRPVDVDDATRAVFQILSRHINRGQIEKVRQSLPEEVRAIWHDEPNAPDVRPRPRRYGSSEKPAPSSAARPRLVQQRSMKKKRKSLADAGKRASFGTHGRNRARGRSRSVGSRKRSSAAAGKDPYRGSRRR